MWIRSVRTGQVKSSCGQFKVRSKSCQVRSGQVEDKYKSGQGRSRSGLSQVKPAHVRSFQDQDQVKVRSNKVRSCQSKGSSAQVRSSQVSSGKG